MESARRIHQLEAKDQEERTLSAQLQLDLAQMTSEHSAAVQRIAELQSAAKAWRPDANANCSDCAGLSRANEVLKGELRELRSIRDRLLAQHQACLRLCHNQT